MQSKGKKRRFLSGRRGRKGKLLRFHVLFVVKKYGKRLQSLYGCAIIKKGKKGGYADEKTFFIICIDDVVAVVCNVFFAVVDSNTYR
jgi:hypothetical protein